MPHAPEEVELRQFQPHQERLVLPLRTLLLHLVVTDLEHEVVLVGTARRVAQCQVATAYGIEQRHKALPAFKVRSVPDRHALAIHRDLAVELLEDRGEVIDKLASGCIDHPPVEVHLLLARLIEQGVGAGRLLLQKAVALQQRLVVAYQRVQVRLVELADHHVHELAPFLAAALQQHAVRRREQHDGQQPDVVAQSLVFLACTLERLSGVQLVAAADVLRLSIEFVLPVQHEELLAVRHHLAVGHAVERLAERQVIDGIQQVGLAHAVLPHQAVHAR